MSELNELIPNRIPPQSLDVEETILGGIIMDGDAMAKAIATGLTGEDFYVKAHCQIWDVMVELHRERQPIDLVTVIRRLDDEGQLEKIGGTPKISALVDKLILTANIETYCGIVRQKAILRRLIKLGQSVAAKCYLPKAEPDKILESARLGLREITEQWLGDDEGELTPLSELADVSYAEIEETIEHRNDPDWRGEIKSGFVDLDEHVVGFSPKDLIVIGGRSGMGKTTFMQNLAINIAQKYGPVLSFHFGELDKSLICKRIISQQSGVGLKQLRNGMLMDEELTKVIEGVSRMGQIPLSIDDRPRTMDSVRDAIDRWQNRYDKTPRAIFLDYVQIIQGPRLGGVERLESIMAEAKYLAGDYDCPVFLGSQINRGTEAKDNKRPSLSELKGCGGIEEKAQHVLLLYREAYYNPDTPDQNITEVNVAKCSNGEPGTIKLFSAMETFNFGNLAGGKRHAMGPI